MHMRITSSDAFTRGTGASQCPESCEASGSLSAHSRVEVGARMKCGASACLALGVFKAAPYVFRQRCIDAAVTLPLASVGFNPIRCEQL
eukprot:702413-Amphidinium_carterae.2